MIREKQREETRRRVYLAALEVFRRDGVHECRIDDIASKAEVSRGAFYFHFPSKDDVLVDLLRESEAPIAASFSGLDEGVGLETVLGALADALAAFWVKERALLPHVATVALRMQAMVNDREADPVRAGLAIRFAAAAARGELSEVLPPYVMSDFFLVNSLAAMGGGGAAPELTLDAVLHGVVHLFLQGVRGEKK